MNETFLIHALAGLGGYLLGAVPFGIVIARLFGLGDLRQIGSGNIGATNVLRTGNKFAAVLTLLLDSGKGAIAVGLTFLLTPEPQAAHAMLAAGFWAVIGHNFPIWLKFKGGKGVATTLGVLLATAWPVGLAAIATWLATAAIFRYSSLAALIALAAAPAYAWYFATPQHAILAGLLAVLAWARHHENIRRLMRGEETKIGKKKTV
ncbi:glycerol-3-phosphate 1-O-acyltransferase PlsY [Magnetovibrio blakemorei]|uniref:Glycerol-3-phosphate acyltransferase n=1 Tax=Magnetovibrio blakemorei TaxID=28181 RepID=A0A1E5Q6X4_9PROT|nr:glycerol-3-phosphate 1-O-acyltransferase PlsY [Magnetovibrio blakemorei]OEJ66796.1 glycerol-3-phosphate acyltransferase [Magnetovibrio blakemorei]